MDKAITFVRPYVWGLLVVVACIGIKVLVGAFTPFTSPYLFFTIAVVLIAYNFGFAPGVFAVALSTLSGYEFERYSLPTPGQTEWQRATTFAVQALVICYICGVRIKTALDRSNALEAERQTRSELDSTSQQLHQSEERYRGMIAAVPQIVFVAEPNLSFEWVNDRWCGFSGLEVEVAHGSGWLEIVEPADRVAVSTAIGSALNANEVLNIELRLRNGATGAFRWHLARAVPVLDREGGLVQWIGTFTDIHDSKVLLTTMQRLNEELETRVQGRTEELVAVNLELEGANAELEAFCYAVSHDLRTPLRAIDGFSQALAQDYGNLLPEDGRNFLERVRSGAHRMDELITSLLKLSRIARQEVSVHVVNLSEIASASWTELGHADGESKAQLKLQPKLRAQADSKLVRIVFDNLLGNALKFTKHESEPIIEVGEVETDRGPAFFVRDNGVGFSMEYAGKLFTPFERLHSPRDYPGSGVGLATVMRCIRKQGGHVWAESVEGKGATFWFTLAPAEGGNGEIGATEEAEKRRKGKRE